MPEYLHQLGNIYAHKQWLETTGPLPGYVKIGAISYREYKCFFVLHVVNRCDFLFGELARSPASFQSGRVLAPD